MTLHVQTCNVIPNSAAAIVLVDLTGSPSVLMGTFTLYISNQQSEGQRTVFCHVTAADGMTTTKETTFSVLGNNYYRVIVTEEGQKKIKMWPCNSCHCTLILEAKIIGNHYKINVSYCCDIQVHIQAHKYIPFPDQRQWTYNYYGCINWPWQTQLAKLN